MRHIVIKEKNFLKKLFRSKKLKVLEEANDNQIRSLAYAIHLVLIKKVPLNQKIISSFLKINQRKINTLKKVFGEKINIDELLNLKKKKQIGVLKKFLPLIKILLSAYFNAKKNNKKTMPVNTSSATSASSDDSSKSSSSSSSH